MSLLDNYTALIEKEMRDRYPWVSGREIYSIIKKAGYQGKATIIGDYMRKIRPVIIDELVKKGILAEKLKQYIKEKSIDNKTISRITNNLIKKGLLKPNEFNNKICKIEAYKTQDGKVFESEQSALDHAEEIIIYNNIDEFTKDLPDKLSKKDVNSLLKQYTINVFYPSIRDRPNGCIPSK
jgi:predicted transcriptional regulator